MAQLSLPTTHSVVNADTSFNGSILGLFIFRKKHMANVHDSNKSILVVCALVFLMVLTGCSGGLSDTPSDSMAKELVESKNAEAIKAGMLQIESFEKTNGLKRVEAGVEQYVLEYKAVLLYPKGFMPECIDESHYNPTCFITRLNYGIGPSPFKEAGARETVSGKILFEKAERGWRATEYSSSKVTGELAEQSDSRRQRRHAKNDQATTVEQKSTQSDTKQPQTNTDGQTGILTTLDRWLEPLIYRAVSYSKRSDGLWLSDGGNEKQIVKAASPSDLDVFEITDGGQVLYSLGGKSYLLPRADASPRQLDLSMYGATFSLSRDGHWAVVADADKGINLVNMNDGTMLSIPKQPLPDRGKVFLEKSMGMAAMQQQLEDPENNRSDRGFVWSADADHLAFVRCAGVCALAIYDLKTRLVTLLPSADGLYRMTDDYRGQPQIYPVLFYANKLIVSEYGLLREYDLNTGRATTLAQGVFAPAAAPDGKRIAYVNSKQPRSVFIRDVPSGEVNKLTSFVAAKDYGFVGLSWSPDNRYLFYGIYYEDGTDGGWMMDMEAKSHHRIPLNADKLDAKITEVFRPFSAETFTRNIHIPRFDFISASGVRNAVIGFMALVAALLVYVFIRLVRNAAARAPGIKQMVVVASARTQQTTADEYIFCTECGAQCAAHGAFCPKCGARL
ncbi:MAG: zinc ribbon domain-containing protein [Burkholderiales bacterium]